jgi:hypothetical protein
MEQRRLRLGDILDDYCPRERRVTNHAVVAMIEEDVKQTRCTTCDAEHVYKGGKAPRRKKSDTTGALYKEVLAGIEEPVRRESLAAAAPAAPDAEPADAAASPIAAVIIGKPAVDDQPKYDEPRSEYEPEPDSEPDSSEHDEADGQIHMLPDEGPVHRPLIRAQLPRPEGLKIERQAPEFTIRQNNGRGGAFRGRSHGSGNGGNGAGGGGQRFGRGPNRGGRGAGQGFGGRNQGGQQQRHGGGPRKRSR